jgi:hypothetical protein
MKEVSEIKDIITAVDKLRMLYDEVKNLDWYVDMLAKKDSYIELLDTWKESEAGIAWYTKANDHLKFINENLSEDAGLIINMIAVKVLNLVYSNIRMPEHVNFYNLVSERFKDIKEV